FTFCSVETHRGTAIVIGGSGPSTVNVVGNFRLANGGSMLPAGTTPTPFLNIGGNALRFGAGTTIQAFMSAPNAVASFGHHSTIMGSFCAQSNRSDKGVTLMCPPMGTAAQIH
ncbi:MAG TPA: hypothetical protein VMR79_05400, partial [Verrucomicrobiae bacterium]|nr:hypothetical protein [Verrucomicrobiae bacterium]